MNNYPYYVVRFYQYGELKFKEFRFLNYEYEEALEARNEWIKKDPENYTAEIIKVTEEKLL